MSANRCPVKSDPAGILRGLLDELPAELSSSVFTHASWTSRRSDSYERLAFLGDSVLALAVNTGSVLAKLFSEAVESIDPRPVEGVRATGAHRLQEIGWGVIPQVGPLWTSYALYRFESNSRSATVLGLIGAGGIGQTLYDSLNGFNFRETSAIVIVIVVAVTLIDLLSQAMRTRLL